ncbi:MAG TPA: hypothetical protein VG917_05700 [Patescibacteria group bacterium]|nr:hypothetical protein [Patescibacteria group bacterium]
MPESRLNRRSVNQGKRQLYVYLISIVVIIFLALNFGPFLLARVGNIIDGITGKNNQTDTVVSNSELQAPTLDPLPDATPSATIKITGQSFYPNGEVELYVNGAKVDSVDVDSSLDFEFKDVALRSGTNTINTRMIIGKRRSSLSDDYTIQRQQDAPSLDITFPSDGASFTKADQQITVQGKTNPDSSVKVNDFIAIVDSSGNFTYQLNLNDGDNNITVVAENPAGKTTTKQIKVTYSQ